MLALINDEYLQDIADAIREVSGTTARLSPADMASHIRRLKAGGNATQQEEEQKSGD